MKNIINIKPTLNINPRHCNITPGPVPAGAVRLRRPHQAQPPLLRRLAIRRGKGTFLLLLLLYSSSSTFLPVYLRYFFLQ